MVVIVSSGERIYEKPFYQKQRMSETPYLCSPFLNKVLPDVVKLVDTSDLGSDAARCGGSSPSIRTAPPNLPQGEAFLTAINL